MKVNSNERFRARTCCYGLSLSKPLLLASGALLLQMSVPAVAQAVPGAAQTASTETKQSAQSTAQPANTADIVVTARKRAEVMQDIPASLAAIPASIIQEQHITRIDDVSGLVSNLHMVQRNDNSPDVTLRGVGSFGVVQGVGFYVNDVQLYEGQIMRPEDIERIEVLKGPQGTLYGGANIGGAVKYVSKDPTASWSEQATAEFGSFAAKNFSGVVSGPLATDTLSIRLSGYHDQQDGYTYDTYHKEFFGTTFDTGGRLTVLWRPDALTKIHFFFTADHFITGAQNLLYTPPNDNTYYYSINDYYIPSFRRSLWSGVTQVDRELSSSVLLTSISAYFHSSNAGVTDFAKQPIPIDELDQNQEHTNYSEELRLTSTGAGNLDWLLGLYYQGHKIGYQSIDNYSTGDVNNPIIVGNDHDYDYKNQNEFAGFANFGYKMGDIKLEVGLRVEYYTSKLHGYNDAYQPILDGSASLHGVQASPHASLQYKFSRDANVYATYSRGFEPADEIEENGIIHSYKAEVADSYEVGLKSSHGRWLIFNMAGFFINYKNRLYQNIQFTPSGLNEVTTNIGPSHNYGIEGDITAKLPLQFKLTGGAGFTKAIWGNTPYIDPLTNLPINLKGLTAPFTPEFSGNLALDWSHEIAPGYVLGFRANGSYTGLSYWDPQDSAKQRPYTLIDLGARLTTSRVEFGAHVSNLTKTRFNTIYAPSYDIGAPFNVAHVNQPREWFLTATVHM